MGEPKGKAKPPDLPDGAPQELKDFIACKRLTVELDLATIGWLPAPPGVPKELAPSVTAEAGATPNTATVSVGWGFLSITLPVSIGSDGQLNVDTAKLPDIENLKSNVDKWVKKFNDSLKGNGKRLSGFTINGTKIAFTKVAIAATGTATTPQTPLPPATKTPPTPPPPSTPGATASTDGTSSTGKGCLLGVLGMVLVGVVGAGIYFVTKDDDKKTASPPVTVEPVAATTSTTTTSTTPTTAAVSVPDCANLDFVVSWAMAETNQSCNWLAAIDPCNPTRLRCGSGVTSPFFVVDPRTIILHDGGPVDPLTQLQGPSSAGHSVFIGSGPAGVLTFSSICGDQLITGQTPYRPGSTGIVSHSLFDFGPCTANSLQFEGGGSTIDLFPALVDPAFTVGPDEVPPESFDPVTFGLVSDDPQWGDSTATFLSTMSDSPYDCVAAFIERAPYRSVGCAGARRVWKYHAVLPVEASGAGPMIAVGAGYANALGSMAPTAADYSQFSTTPIWATNGLFPCGQGPLGLAICPGNSAPRAEAGGYLAITILSDTTAGRQFTIDLGQGQTSITIDTAANTFFGGVEGLTPLVREAGGDTSPIVVVTDRVLYALVPDAVLPPDAEVAVSLTTSGVTIDYQPVAIDNVTTLPSLFRNGAPATTTSTSSIAPTVEAADEFLQQLSESLATGDGSFALSRLHPKVIETFGQDVCNQTVPATDDQTFNLTLVSEGAHGPWDWPQPDGTTIRIDDAVTFDVQITQQGSTAPAQVHLVLLDGMWRWFTYCVP